MRKSYLGKDFKPSISKHYASSEMSVSSFQGNWALGTAIAECSSCSGNTDGHIIVSAVCRSAAYGMISTELR